MPALLILQRHGYTHPSAGFYSLYGTLQVDRTLHCQPRPESRADPQHVVQFEKHPACADVPCPRAQTCRSPLDFYRYPVWKTRGFSSFCPPRFQLTVGHGTDDLGSNGGAQRSIACSVPLRPKIRPDSVLCFRHRKQMFCSRYFPVEHIAARLECAPRAQFHRPPRA